MKIYFPQKLRYISSTLCFLFLAILILKIFFKIKHKVDNYEQTHAKSMKKDIKVFCMIFARSPLTSNINVCINRYLDFHFKEHFHHIFSLNILCDLR
jgi:hypothetical protein